MVQISCLFLFCCRPAEGTRALLPRRTESPLCVALVYTGSIQRDVVWRTEVYERDISDDLLECVNVISTPCNVTRWGILTRHWNDGRGTNEVTRNKKKRKGLATVNYLGDWDRQRRHPGRTGRSAQGSRGRWWQKNKRRLWEYHMVVVVPCVRVREPSRVCLLPNTMTWILK